jgi:hypothetical protein
MYWIIPSAFYFLIGCWLLQQLVAKWQLNLSRSVLWMGFGLFFLTGWVYQWVGMHWFQGRFDTFTLYREGLIERGYLLNNPSEYFTNWGINAEVWANSDSVTRGNSLWTQIQGNFHLKLMGLFLLLSGGYYEGALVLYSFLLYTTTLLWYRRIQDWVKVPYVRWWGLLLCCLPGALFWIMGLYKEGYVFIGLIWLSEGLYARRWHWVVLAWVFLGLTRLYIALMLLPFIGYGWWWYHVRKREGGKWWPGFLLLFVGLQLLVQLVQPGYVPKDIQRKRQEFIAVPGNSKLPEITLTDNWVGLAKAFPTALKPYGWLGFQKPEASSKLYYWAQIENLMIALVVLVWAFSGAWREPIPVWWQMMMVMAVLQLVVIGYTVPFLGAVVRYRSLYLIFIIFPLITAIYKKYQQKTYLRC